MTTPLRLAISTCPNDTFAFHALLERKVDWDGLEFDVQLLDIQQLNDGLMAGQFDVAKASFHAAARLASTTWVLPSGSALGFGVGPLLLAAIADTTPDQPIDPSSELPSLTLCPGELTSASMLFQLFYSESLAAGRTKVEQALFSSIMPRLKTGFADFGVCIHEGRFTWQSEGLALVVDLGTRWEQLTGCPLPLGGILASRELPRDTLDRIQGVVQSSIRYGLEHREETATTMRKYAQELDDCVLYQHVDLYVNQWTLDLGETGRDALAQLSRRVQDCGLIAPGSPEIEIWR